MVRSMYLIAQIWPSYYGKFEIDSRNIKSVQFKASITGSFLFLKHFFL